MLASLCMYIYIRSSETWKKHIHEGAAFQNDKCNLLRQSREGLL